MKTVLEARTDGITRLRECAESLTLPALDVELLLAHVLETDRVHLLAHLNDPLPPEAEHAFEALLSKRLTHTPMAHLIGKKAFAGAVFEVTPATLIPRPNSEDLLPMVEDAVTAHSPTVVADIGTGSGALAITLRQRLPAHVRVLATDFSREALQQAEHNAQTLQSQNIEWFCGDLLQPLTSTIEQTRGDHAWVIVANLPYLPTTLRADLLQEVVAHEPHHALFSGPDGLDAIYRLCLDVRKAFAGTRFPITVVLEVDREKTDAAQQMVQRLFFGVKTVPHPQNSSIFSFSWSGVT